MEQGQRGKLSSWLSNTQWKVFENQKVKLGKSLQRYKVLKYVSRRGMKRRREKERYGERETYTIYKYI